MLQSIDTGEGKKELKFNPHTHTTMDDDGDNDGRGQTGETTGDG